VKLLTTFLIASLAALTVYAARKRIFFALRTGAIVYVSVLFVRLLFSAGSLADRWEDVLWPVLLMAVAWGVVWLASNAYIQRRARARRWMR
jgi:hypothetical protein